MKTYRVTQLRKESMETEATLSTERAELISEFYKKERGLVSAPVFRAMAFEYLLENEHIHIGEYELIVGEKGAKPKSAPTFPELCCHSLNDLQQLHHREKVPFTVSEDAHKIYADEIIPFWQGKTMRDLIFQEMTPDWIDSYEAGIFTEFMEQRAPGHTVLDDKIYKKGMLDFKSDIENRLRSLDFHSDAEAYKKEQELKAMGICADALIKYAGRYAAKARMLGEHETDPGRKRDLDRIAEVCSRVPANAPRNFWEAIQYYWFVHLGVTKELNTWDAFSPGHLDRHLYPFYKVELEAGTLTKDQAEELLQCLWVKFHNQPAPPKVGVTAEESGTYNDFAQINLGGLMEDGSDGINDVTYLILDVVEEMRLVQPSVSIHVSKKSPNRFINRAARIIRTGFGQPSIFNSDAVIQEMVGMGKSLRDARNGGTSGCVETGAFGKENYCLTGYLNLPKILEIALHNGIDPRTGKEIGLRTGDPNAFETFDELFEAFKKQLAHFVDIKIRANQVIEQLYAHYLPAPFLSLLIDDCVERGMDYHVGGARYNTSYIQGVGIGTISDSLSALSRHVFDEHIWSMKELIEILEVDFKGHERERLRLINR
ncbi:MAG: hypothetical protein MUO76_20690, partial [Anaerolineaceae bacterium]|nr:hypothetical protein [Anaerolineaceae bacterium]